MLQNQIKSEFLGQPEGRHQVIGAMAVEVHGAFAFHNLNERFHANIAVGWHSLGVFGQCLAMASPKSLVIASF